MQYSMRNGYGDGGYGGSMAGRYGTLYGGGGAGY